MPLFVLAPLVVVGVGLVVLLVHLGGGSKRAAFASEADALAAAATEFPGMAPGRPLLTADRGAAFFHAGDKVAALLPLGSKHVARIISAREASVAAEGENSVRIGSADMATPAMSFAFADRRAADTLLAWLMETADA
jgi:hypothetical protein